MNENSKLIEAAVEAVTLTLENMVFEQPQLLETSIVAPPHPKKQENRESQKSSQSYDAGEEIGLVWASIPILAPYYGKISVVLAETFARDLAQNLYSGDDCKAHDLFLDVLAEILNTLAGRFMIALLGGVSNFEIGFPSTGKGSCDEPINPAWEGAVHADSGDGGDSRFILLKFDISGQIFQLKIAGEDLITMRAEMAITTETTT